MTRGFATALGRAWFGVVLVVCKTDATQGARGTSILIVETADCAGFRVGRLLDKVGMKAQDTAELFFDNVRVPHADLVGEEGKGLQYAAEQLPQGRLAIAVASIGSAVVLLVAKRPRQAWRELTDVTALMHPFATFGARWRGRRASRCACRRRSRSGRRSGRRAARTACGSRTSRRSTAASSGTSWSACG